MKKTVVLAALLAVTSALTAHDASAHVRRASAGPALAWGCNLSARVEGTDFAFIIRGTDMWGKGKVRCRSLTGKIYESPIEIHMVGGGIGAQFAIPTRGQKACLQIGNANIGVSNPRAMFGQFRLAPEVNLQLGGVQLAAGAGVTATVRNGGGVSGQVHIKALCNASVGLGLGINANVINIMTPAQARLYRARYYPVATRRSVQPARYDQHAVR
jgi:hypothetical protein